MTSKERVIASLNHKQPDKVPMDFGSHSCSQMHVACVIELRKHFGLDGYVKIADSATMTGIIEQDLLEALGCDLDGVQPYANTFGFPNTDWKEWDYFGHTVLVPGNFQVTNDGSGGYFIYPNGDLSAPPSGHMTKCGHYFDNVIRQQSFKDENDLNFQDNLEEYAPVTKDALEYYKNEVDCLKNNNRGLVANFGYTALGDISIIPGPSLAHPKGIRSIEDWYMAPLLYPGYVHDFFREQTKLAIENLTKIKDAVGDAVDVAYVCGTDFGTQISTFVSKDALTEFWIPYYKIINNWIHTNTNWKTFKHSCGAIFEFIPLLIEAGFDILNPVQCSAAGMEPERLKKEFGKDIVFWGGGIDTQHTLPFGKTKEVREQVLRRCEIFAPDGGFIFNTIHVVQSGTPVENIIAVIDAVHEFNGD